MAVKEQIKLDKVEARYDFGAPSSVNIKIEATIGGKSFGYNAEIRAQVGGFGMEDGEVRVEAGQSSIGMADPRIALIRARLYERAAFAANDIRRSLEAGESLFEALRTTEDEVGANGGVLVRELGAFADGLRSDLAGVMSS